MTTYMLHFNNNLGPGYPLWTYGAIGKCRHDWEVYCQQMGGKLIDAFTYDWDKEPDDVLSSRLDGILGGLKRNDIVIVNWEFAMDSNRWINEFIDRVHLFGAKLVFLMLDINSWRDLDPLTVADVQTPEKFKDTQAVTYEARFFAKADGLLLHSPEMRDRLQIQMDVAQKKMPAAIAYLGPTGYSTVYYADRRQPGNGIDYAGSLSKAKFLLHLPEDFKINVFGAKPSDAELAQHDNLNLHAKLDPEAVPTALKGSYGLVWDSEGYPEATGRLADYERVNSPGKFPMYLAADEPVIIWSQAALAPYVRENGIGLVVDDLSQLPDLIAQQSDDAYLDMVKNVERISPLIRDGYYIKRGIMDIQAKLLDRHTPAW